MLTPEQIKEYLNSGGNSCPYCGSYDVEGGFIGTDSGIAWQNVNCSSCGHGWTDHYHLVGIDEDED